MFERKLRYPLCVVMVGLPGSGKSTLAKNLHLQLKTSFEDEGISCSDFYVHSSDAIREELFGDASDQQNPKLVFDTLHSRLYQDLINGYDVVFDATNLCRKNREDFLNNIIGNLPCYTICVFVNTSLDVCLQRNALRERKVPEEVILKMNEHMEYPASDEGFDYIYTVEV